MVPYCLPTHPSPSLRDTTILPVLLTMAAVRGLKIILPDTILPVLLTMAAVHGPILPAHPLPRLHMMHVPNYNQIQPCCPPTHSHSAESRSTPALILRPLQWFPLTTVPLYSFLRLLPYQLNLQYISLPRCP